MRNIETVRTQCCCYRLFFDQFKIDPETVEAIRSDDVALMKFAFKWLRFSLFNEPLIEVRKEALERKQEALAGAEMLASTPQMLAADSTWYFRLDPR